MSFLFGSAEEAPQETETVADTVRIQQPDGFSTAAFAMPLSSPVHHHIVTTKVDLEKKS